MHLRNSMLGEEAVREFDLDFFAEASGGIDAVAAHRTYGFPVVYWAEVDLRALCCFSPCKCCAW